MKRFLPFVACTALAAQGLVFASADTVSPAKTPRILGVSHMAVKVSDIEKSVPFYRDFLGFAEHCRLNSLKDGSLSLAALKDCDVRICRRNLGGADGAGHSGWSAHARPEGFFA